MCLEFKNFIYFSSFFIILILSQNYCENKTFNYPNVFRDENIYDNYFGTNIYDPYRWLENTISNDTKKFIYEQNSITEPYLKLCPYREKIRKKFENLLQYERVVCPFKRGPYYYIYKNEGLQNHHILYKMLNGFDDLNNIEIFINTNTINDDDNKNESISLALTSFSNDGKWCAYGLDKSGSDWNTIRIRSVENKTDLSDILTNIKFSSASWTHDNKGFFYSRYPNESRTDGTETSVNKYNKLYYHRIGTNQNDDILIYETPDKPLYRFYGKVSDCGEYLNVFIKQSSEFEAWYYYHFDNNITINGKLSLIPIIKTFDSNFEYISNDGPIHYMLTNRNASNYRLVKVNLTNNDSLNESQWIDIIPEDKSNVLRSVKIVNDNIIICHYIHNVKSSIEIRNLTNNGLLIKKLNIPLGFIDWITGQRKNNTQVFFSITSFLVPTSIYRIDLNNLTNIKLIIYRQSFPKNFDANNFITKQIFYQSKDGTKIPLFIAHKKNLTYDGTNPTLLYGYGGFNSIIKPHFSPSKLIMLENLNGIFAIAGIRGGGEYGKNWHRSGKLLNKKNSFDDFIAAAEYLIQNNYTESKKLIIEGGSNGGLLVMAVSNQRPDLFGCTICNVGLLDMLRFPKFTIGHAWISEYGNPESDEKYFHYLLSYSPLHNIPFDNNLTNYPATLLLTADHDDRVVPLHSYKFISQLQYKLGKKFSNKPFMIRIDTGSGHGGSKPTDKIILETVDIYSFIINSLSLKYTD